MIEIELRSKDGGPYDLGEIDTHQEFVDFPERSSKSRTRWTQFGIHRENIVAPIVAALHGKNALATFPDLVRAEAELEAAFPNREDGRHAISIAKSWSRRYPDGLWQIAGAERVAKTRFIAIASEPRHSSSSLAIDALAVRKDEWILEGERMDDMVGAQLEPLSDERDISGPALLQREVRITGRSHSSSGRVREKPKRGEGVRIEQLPGASNTRNVVVGVRVTVDEKKALDSDPEGKRRMMEATARAILSGRSYEDVIASIERPEN